MIILNTEMKAFDTHVHTIRKHSIADSIKSFEQGFKWAGVEKFVFLCVLYESKENFDILNTVQNDWRKEMKEAELKPCRCGSTKSLIMQDKLPIFSAHRRACMIVCEGFLCGNEVVEYGFTKRGAYKKAVKIWNRRADNE